jgi:hypothetical protein
MAIYNFTDGVITWLDDGGGNTLEVTFDGSFTLDVPGRQITFAKDRGELPATPEPIVGPEQEMTVSFDAKVQSITSNGAAVPGDVVFGEFGSGYIATNWQSTLGASARAFLLDLTYFDGLKTIRLNDGKYVGKYQEAEDGNFLSFTGTIPHAYPTIS